MPQRGYVYDITSGQYLHELSPLPRGAWCSANAINSKGVVCGYRSIGSKGDPVNPFTAFTWDGTNYTDIGVLNGPNSSAEDIAEDGAVVGWTGGNIVSFETRAFVWHNGQATILPPFPGGLNSFALACTSSSRVVVQGRVQIAPAIYRSALHDGRVLHDLGSFPGFETIAAQACDDGRTVVGSAIHIQNNSGEGLIWNNGLARNLNDLVPEESDVWVSSAEGITAAGEVVATGANARGEVVAMVLVPVIVEGDAYPDCVLNIDDLISVVLSWDEHDSPADVTGDGLVNVDDLILVINNWRFN